MISWCKIGIDEEIGDSIYFVFVFNMILQQTILFISTFAQTHYMTSANLSKAAP